MTDLSVYPKKIKLKSRKQLTIRPMETKDEAKVLHFLQGIPLEHRLFLRDDVADEKTVKSWAKNLNYETIIPLLGEADRKVVANIDEWDDCLRCPEFEHCYRFCMGKLALEDAVAKN